MIVTLTCENDNTTHEVLYVDKDFEFGAIQWALSLAPPVGYSRTLSLDQIKLVREDFEWFKSKVLIYGDTLKMVLSVNSRDYLVDLTDYTLYENYVEFGLKNTGVEADFADKKDSEITLTPVAMLNTTGGFALTDKIIKSRWRWAYYLAGTNKYRNTEDGSVIYSDNIETNEYTLIKFYEGYPNNSLSFDIEVHINQFQFQEFNEPVHAYASLVLANDKNDDIIVLRDELEGEPLPNDGFKVYDQTVKTNSVMSVYPSAWHLEVRFYPLYGVDPEPIIRGSGDFIRMTFHSTDVVRMPNCPAVSIWEIFDRIFGAGRYVLPTLGIGQLVFVNSDMLNDVPDPKLTIKVSEFLKDVCNATASAMVFDNGKYKFKPIADLTTINQLQLPYVKDFKISFSKAMDYTEFEFGSKMPNYKFMVDDRNFFTQKITWQPENLFGKKFSLSLSKLRVDCVGIYDCIRSFVGDETSNNNSDYWAVVIDPYTVDTVKPSTITGVDQQTGWFNLDLSPRSQMKRYASLLKSFLNYKPKTIKVSAAENYMTTMEYDGSGQLLDDYDLNSEDQLFTNLECKFTTMLTTDEISLLQNEMRLLQISVSGKGYMVFPTNIEFTEGERQECDIQGIIANISE